MDTARPYFSVMILTLQSMTVWKWLLFGSESFLLYIFGLCIYRLYFHPLSKFPGPKIAAFSDYWICSRWLSGYWPSEIERLHREYGDIVRIAPNDLSFLRTQSLKDIYSNSTHQFHKFPTFYRQSDTPGSIGTETDPVKHQEYRKLLGPGFSAPALKAQTSIVIHYVDHLVQQLKTNGQKPGGTNITRWNQWLAFDVIMDLSFGESLKNVERGEGHPWVTMLTGSGFQVALGYVLRRQHPIFTSTIRRVLLNKASKYMREQHLRMSRDMAIKRLNHKNPDRVDLFSHLIGTKSEPSVGFLAAQGSTLVAAGTETTSTFLSAATYYLLHNPDKLEKMKDEVRGAFADDAEIDGENTKKLPYLNAVIEEGLRIFPPAPFGLPRVCPGAFIDGVWVPQGTVVATAAHATVHDPRYFHLPQEFHPERWLPSDHPDYDVRFANDIKDASKPFSIGPRWCIGSYLSYMEMRITFAKVAWNFDWAIAPGHEGDFVRDARLLGLWRAPDLMVNYTPAVHRK